MKRLLIAFAALALAMTSPVAAQADPVSVRSELDRAVMTIGDQLLLTVTVELATGYDLVDPGVPRAIGDFEMVEALTVLQSRLPNGTTRVVLRYLITAFELGPHQLPVIAVGYRGPTGEGEARTASGHVVSVASVIQPGEDTSDIKPLKPPLPLPATDDLASRAAPVAVAVLVTAAAVLALRRRPHARPAVAEVATHGPARRALDELQRVAELRLPEAGRTSEHYGLVSAAVRAFIAERHGVPADARTARELRGELERAGVDRGQVQLLYEVLADAEAVRYEERVIYPARAQKAMRDVLEVMRKRVVAEEYELVGSEALA